MLLFRSGNDSTAMASSLNSAIAPALIVIKLGQAPGYAGESQSSMMSATSSPVQLIQRVLWGSLTLGDRARPGHVTPQ